MDLRRLKNKLLARLTSRFPSLAKRLAESYSPRESQEVPWTPFVKPLSECTAGLVTTAGVHHIDQQPFNMNDRDGDPSFRVIDATCGLDTLTITHDYYDHRDADRDINIVFPIERLQEFSREGIIGKLIDRNYSFMGHITGPHIMTLIRKTAPEVARRLKQSGVDIVLLTPG